MKAPVTCLGCDRELGKNDAAIQAKTTSDEGVITEWNLCTACGGRILRDKAFGNLLDAKLARRSGSIEA